MKRFLHWCAYVFAGLALLLGCMMLMAGKFALAMQVCLVGALIFFPVGYYFRLLSRRRPESEELVEEEAVETASD